MTVVAGRYELLEQLGAGGEGRVFRAHDQRTDTDVALKRLETASRRIRVPPHHGIVTELDSFVEAEVAWSVLEWVDGTNLAARLAVDGPLPADEVTKLLAGVADALVHLHKHGAVHGDLKPANIVVRRDGVPVLVDLSHGRAGHGTDGFRSPEVAAGARPSPAADTFGLAATAVALLTATVPADAGAVNAASPVWRRGLVTDPKRRPAPDELVRAVVDAIPCNVGVSAGIQERPAVVAEIAVLARNHRLVSVTGLDPAGNARLVVAAGQRLRQRFPGGVWHARVESDRVDRAVGASMEMPSPSSLEAIAARIGALPTLFVFEGTLTAGSIDELRRACPAVSILIGTTAPLGLPDEVVVPVIPRRGASVAHCTAAERNALVRLAVFPCAFDAALADDVGSVAGDQLAALVDRGLVERVAADRFRVALDVGPGDAATRELLRAWCADRLGRGDVLAYEQSVPLVAEAIEIGDEIWLAQILAGFVDEAVCRGDSERVFGQLDALRKAPQRFPLTGRTAAFADVSNRHLRLDEIARWADVNNDVGLAAVCDLRRLARQPDDEETAAKLRRLVATFAAVGDTYSEAVAWADLGITLANQDNVAGGVAALNRAVELAEAAPNPWTAGMVHTQLAALASSSLVPSDAIAHAEAAVRWFGCAGHAARAAQALANLALYTFDTGALDEGLDIAERALVEAAALGSPRFVAIALSTIALGHVKSDPERTLVLLGASRAMDPEGFGARAPDLARLTIAQQTARASLGARSDVVETRGAGLDMPGAVDVALAP